ncbi:MAG: aminotransferase class I/II-fold pyridoxal phosphate-dependent enzyme [Phycisphaerales bacterium]|jgi:cystathionine beta-lyase/cystathionine gamma-synthase
MPLPASADFHADLLCPGLGRELGDGHAAVTPLVQSTTFARDGIGSTCEHQYSRVSNPTVAELERVLGELDGAPPAPCFATGLAAETALFLALVKAGDHVVCGQSVYGGTTRLLREVLAPLGIDSTFVDATDPASIARAIRPNTRVIFAETPANPSLEICDIGAIARIAKAANAKLVVDNTFMTPVLQKPLDLGADICVYSTTKFIEGHSTALGGSVSSRDEAFLARLRFIRKCTGAIQTPFGAWLTLQGVRTLPLRLRHQSASAATIATWLTRQPGVTRVNYPTLAGGEQARLANLQHLGGHGAVVSFDVGSLEAACDLAQSVGVCRLAEHVGSVETLLTHPATMTHADVPRQQRELAGITDGLLRLSVGLEPPQAITDDLAAALATAGNRLPNVRLGKPEVPACL